ncbi:MAG: SDR family NAD(P)-dependent oxidoreductase, partial [Erysipelotrichaceae bacterium]|nr:SDR family NAD(P)-dependent oxidoreductase [Erysipelotrichaceae bacterium]
INNAGAGWIGPFVSQSVKGIQKMNRLNLETPMELCRMVLPEMIQRKKGTILNICSIGAFTPGPFTAQYYAEKSALLSFSLALRDELKSSGVEVCAYCPGTIKTGFFQKAGGGAQSNGMSPKQAAKAAWKGLQKNRGIIFASRLQHASLLIPRSVRQAAVAGMKRRSMKPS